MAEEYENFEEIAKNLSWRLLWGQPDQLLSQHDSQPFLTEEEVALTKRVKEIHKARIKF